MRMFSLVGLALAAMSISSACSTEPPAERPPEPAAPEPAAPEPAAPEPAAPEPPAPVAELPPLDHTCKADRDCVPAPGCCPVPCTHNVINRSALPEAQRRLEALCPEVLECGSAGGCRTHEYLCVKGSCALVYQ